MITKWISDILISDKIGIYQRDVSFVAQYNYIPWLLQQANLENCGPPPGNNFDLEVGQGQSMVQIERACNKDHACQIPMLYH